LILRVVRSVQDCAEGARPSPGGITCWGGGEIRENLWPYASAYIAGRARRGELGRDAVRGYRATLLQLARAHGNRPIERFGRATIERWQEDLATAKRSSMRTKWSQVNRFCDHLVREGVIRTNPCDDMEAPRRPRSVPRAIDADQVSAVIACAPDARARAILWLMVGLGLRVVEVHRARVEDWSRRDQVLTVRGKGDHERLVPVIPPVAKALDAYLGEHPATVGPLIRSYRTPHRPLSRRDLGAMVSRWLTEAAVKLAPGDGCSAHALRHTAASDVLDACGDLRVVQELLGHTHLSSTSVYLRRSRLGEVRDAMDGRWYGTSPVEAIG
jgi:site-specific recombinase XerC